MIKFRWSRYHKRLVAYGIGGMVQVTTSAYGWPMTVVTWEIQVIPDNTLRGIIRATLGPEQTGHQT
jgi:hypothetical protein